MEQKTVGEPSLRIAIQGYQGAFHEIAARHYYAQPIEIVTADTFAQVAAWAADESVADGALMAIENSIAGSLLENYKLLQDSSLQIVGEVYLRIKQNLMALPGQSIADLREVHSHPIAIQQCRQFFEKQPHIKLVEAVDTALSAKLIYDRQLRGVGAIAGKLAADIYKLEVLGESIETNKQNYTRFLVLKPQVKVTNIAAESQKVSVCFSVLHKIGSLYKVLGALAASNANLTKIQSVPIVGEPWEYLFFMDFVLDKPESFEQTIQHIQLFTKMIKVLGKYEMGKYYED